MEELKNLTIPQLLMMSKQFYVKKEYVVRMNKILFKHINRGCTRHTYL